MNYNNQYLEILRKLDSAPEVGPRGMKTKELLLEQIIINPEDNIITIPGFETNVEYAKEELRWYRSGTNRIDFSDIINKTWQKYSDDGKTVNSAYGHRIFGKHEHFINQWEWVKQKLLSDKDSRQAVINLNDVIDKRIPTKDFICTIAIQVFNRNEHLHWITMMRSQDIYYGTRNDIYCFTELQKQLANELNLKLGFYTHIMNSCHIYKKQYKKLQSIIG